MSTTGKKRLAYLKNKQQLLYLMLFSLATVIIWVTISLVTSQKRPGISPELQKLATPLNPVLNQETLRHVEQKQFFSEAELQRFPIYRVITAANGIEERVVTIDTAIEDIFPTAPQPSPVPSPEPSPAPSLEPEPTVAPTAEPTPTVESS